MFLPGDTQSALQALLANAEITMNGVPLSVGSVGDLNTDEDGELIFDPPCARTFFVTTDYGQTHDNLALAYDDSSHEIDIWCAAENLRSLEAQRLDTLTLVAQILPVVAGARLLLPDGSTTEPVRLRNIVGSLQGRQGAPVTTVYTIKVQVPGIAQFPPHAGE
jgi:hypothetical protein